MFSFQNEKGFCIKYVTIWYHPILQYVENSPQTWQEEGWSSPSVVGTLPDVTVWTDWFLLFSAYRGIIVKKSGFHIWGWPRLPHTATFLSVYIHCSLPQRPPFPNPTAPWGLKWSQWWCWLFQYLPLSMKCHFKTSLENQHPNCDVLFL